MRSCGMIGTRLGDVLDGAKDGHEIHLADGVRASVDDLVITPAGGERQTRISAPTGT